MLKAVAEREGQEPLLLMGLEAGNIARLKAGFPISVDLQTSLTLERLTKIPLPQMPS